MRLSIDRTTLEQMMVDARGLVRWRIENAFDRLKDFRRIATRYDKLARNYLASVCLAAALVWWI